MERKKKNILELTRCSAEEYRGMRKRPIIVVADNVRSMHNIGSIFRTADAFLIKEIVLGGISGYPPNPDITKTALGAEETVKWRYTEDTAEEVEKMKGKGWKICALEQAHGSIPLHKFVFSPGDKLVLVVGNEVSGVDQRIVDMSDYILEIPQFGTKHSLNVSVSAGIALYALSNFFCK